MNDQEHLHSLDILRGFAATAVVFWHWQHFFMEGSQLQSTFNRTEQPCYALLSLMYLHGHLAVPFFFQLSGFVFFWLYRKKLASGAVSSYRFAVLRFARLYPLHALTLILVLALQILHERVLGGYFVYLHNDAYHFALHTAFVSHWGFQRGHSFNAPIWSVSIEVGLYCLFYLYCRVRLPDAVKMAAILLGIVLVIELDLGGGRWPPAILAFFLGGLVYNLVKVYLKRNSKGTDSLIVLASLAGWVGVMVSASFEHWLLTSGHNCLFFLFPITIASMVVAERRFPAIPKYFSWTGNLTYSSYLLHFPLQLAAVIFVCALGYDESVFKSTLALGVFLLLLFSLSLVAYHFVERPLQDLFRVVLLPKQPSRRPDVLK